MDPKECIESGIRAANSGDVETAAERLDDYRQWVWRGGFEAERDRVSLLERLVDGAAEMAVWGGE